jgi:hypothetical protein
VAHSYEPPKPATIPDFLAKRAEMHRPSKPEPSYEDRRQLLDLQAKMGRITVAQAQVEVEKLMSAQADHLDKMAGAFWQDHGMARAYQTKAQEVRDSIPAEVRRIGGTASERLTLQKAVTVAAEREHGVVARLDRLEKAIAADPTRRPIGMPLPATTTPTGSTTRRGPDNRPTWPTKPVSEMTNEQRAAYYKRLVREAATPADARMWAEMSEKYAEAAREERS